MKKRGLLIYYTKWQNDQVYKMYFNMYKNFLKKYDIKLDYIKLDEYVLCIENGKPNIDVTDYDFCIMLVKDQYISTLFEKLGKPCFNGYKEMCSADDKFLTYVKLAENGIPLPKTLSGNTDFDGLKLPDFKRSEKFRNKVEKLLSYPFVAKPTYGYGGKGVVKISNRKEFDDLLDNIGQEAYLYQEFIPDNPGSDIRVVVVGGKVVSSVMRNNPNSFVSNVSSGGSLAAHKVSKEQKQIAQRVAKILGLSHCAVDFFNTVDGRPLICEVNANAGGVKSIEKLTGINQVEKFVDYIVKNIYKK